MIQIIVLPFRGPAIRSLTYGVCLDDSMDLDGCPNLVSLTAVQYGEEYEDDNEASMINFFGKIKARCNLRQLELRMEYDGVFDYFSSAVQSNMIGNCISDRVHLIP